MGTEHALTAVGSLSDVEAIEAKGWPEDIGRNTYDVIQQSAAAHPADPALSFFASPSTHRETLTWSYRELADEITRSANAFHGLGAEKDTVIAYILPNLPETHFAIWGAQAAGIVFAINPMLESEAIRGLLEAANASIVVSVDASLSEELAHKVALALQGASTVNQLVLVGSPDRESLRPGVAVPGEPPPIPVYDFAELRADQPADRLVSSRVIDPDDISSYFCTGGTTGLPKIAVRRHRHETANCVSTSLMLSGGISRGKNIFCGLPLFHVNAVLVTGLVPFANGAHVVLGTPQGYRTPGLLSMFWDIVQHHRLHFFSAVPTVYAALLEEPIDGHDLRTLEFGICGAAPLPVQVMRQFESRTGVKILEGYGLTEATCTSSVNPPDGERRTGSIGIRIPFQAMRTMILDEDGGYVRECGVDEIGAIAVCGPNVFDGYLVESQNESLWIDRGDSQRWLNTGDLGRQDVDGYFWLTGRTKELIIRAGHNIDPALIEQPLYSHPAVKYAAAVGRPDARVGELPVAYVELRAGASATEAELLDFAHEHITERAAKPKAVHVIDEMPVTAVGKIFKPALDRRETESALTDALFRAGITGGRVEMSTDPQGPTDAFAFLPSDADREAAAAALAAFAFRHIIVTN